MTDFQRDLNLQEELKISENPGIIVPGLAYCFYLIDELSKCKEWVWNKPCVCDIFADLE